MKHGFIARRNPSPALPATGRVKVPVVLLPQNWGFGGFLLFCLLLLSPAHADSIRRVWTIPVPNIRTMALSPEGDAVAVLSDVAPGAGREKLALWRWRVKPDRPVWVRPELGTSFVVVGPGGEYVLTGTRYAPSRPFVHVRQGTDGAQVTRIALDGAVWDMAVSPDGRYAGVTSGGRAAYILTLDGTFGSRRIPLAGIGTSLTFAPDGNAFTVGTWDAGGVQCFTPGGAPLWQWTDAGAHTAQVQEAGTGVLGQTAASVRGMGETLRLWPGRGDGQPRWTYTLPPDAENVHALAVPDSGLVAVSYAHWLPHTALRQSRLLLLDTADGHKRWERGSFLFAPTLRAIAPDGSRITVSDGKTTLYNLDGAGRITSTYNLGAIVLQAQATPNGRFLLTATGAGTVSLFQLD